MINNYTRYVKGLGGSEEVQLWVERTLAAKLRKTSPKQVEVEHILDYLISDEAPRRLRRMSYEQAKVGADKWLRAQIKRGRHIQEQPTDVETLHQFADGSRIVKLIDRRAFEREGFLMSHCVASYYNNASEVYSYRDSKNNPHATFEVQRERGELVQIKGKGNGSIHPKYIQPILTFLDILKMRPRPSEMKYLGYLHVPTTVQQVIRTHYEEPEYYYLFGEAYVYINNL